MTVRAKWTGELYLIVSGTDGTTKQTTERGLSHNRDDSYLETEGTSGDMRTVYPGGPFIVHGSFIHNILPF